MDVGRKRKFCIEIYKNLNNLNPTLMKKIYIWSKIISPARKRAISIKFEFSKKEAVAFRSKSLGSLGMY